MADLRDFTGKNRVFTGTDAETISSGTTAQRVDGAGKIRFNTTTNLMEYYDGTDWKAIDAPPVVTGFTVDDVGGSSVTSATVDNEKTADSGLFTIEINGSLFDTTGAGVTFIATAGNGETVNTQSITRNSANKLTVTVTASDFDVANSPYTIRVTNGSGLSANLEACISADADAPSFTNAADTNVDVFDGIRGSVSIAAATLVGASGVVASSSAYAIQSGSLPSGLSLNTTSGVITGSTSAVGSDTVSTFTIRATSTEGGTTDRQFTITLKPPQINSYTSGSGTFTQPTGITAIDVLVIAGGGSGSSQHAGGGGAGGLIYRPAFPISGPVSYSVGGGTSGQPSSNRGQQGNDSTFSTLTAKGGGAAAQGWPANDNGSPGGSGGAGSGGPSTRDSSAGSATQPGQPGDSGTYGFGNTAGIGNNFPSPQRCGGGGGGSGGGGQPDQNGEGGIGGSSRSYSISGSSVAYAGGGGGGGHGSPSQGGPGGGGGAGDGGNHPGERGFDATANRGSGGGGGSDGGNIGGGGGSGIIIVSY